ncbi:MAG: hypothetical protein HYV97_09405 [Bdellovibrio sp.]|nr:hypothetical protein [Bdellovibrio sp.]
MALGLNDVLNKQSIASLRKDLQQAEFTSIKPSVSKRLKPWESPQSVSNTRTFEQEAIDLDRARTRAQHAVQKAREIISRNNLMIDEIHNRRQFDREMELSIPKQGPRSFEGLNHVDIELSEKDPVLKLWKRSFWERISDILH